MDPDSTTTMGEGESDTTERPFQSMNAVERTSAKLRSCVASCRGCMFARPIIFAAGAEVERWSAAGGNRSCGGLRNVGVKFRVHVVLELALKAGGV